MEEITKTINRVLMRRYRIKKFAKRKHKVFSCNKHKPIMREIKTLEGNMRE